MKSKSTTKIALIHNIQLYKNLKLLLYIDVTFVRLKSPTLRNYKKIQGI